MASLRVDIVSIGTLSRNRLWNEAAPLRTPHATTSLVRTGKRNILIDPGLPGSILAARLNERTGLRPDAIDTVFLTNLRPAHRAGVSAFPAAKVLAHELEIQHAKAQFSEFLERSEDDDLDAGIVQTEQAFLDRVDPAEDQLAPHLDLFPLFGYTPGACGLLVSLPTLTVLIAGDAVPTQDHFLAGQILPDAFDVQKAQESLREAYEIADLIIPGHDNLFLNPRSQGM
jgi:glyoxylase-like metal-dependent hydrolase (beta-lactamase superfamily II)